MKYNNIYVICPYGLVTGGPDALHQLVYYCKKNGINASVVYSDISKRNKEIPAQYKCYTENYLTLNDIIDSSTNAIIVPETLTNILPKYKNLNKYIWWLSVQNDTNVSTKKKIQTIIKKIFNIKNIKKIYKFKTLINYLGHKTYKFDDDSVKHLCASYYAYDYVSSRCQKNVNLLIEPISKYFLDNSYDSNYKEDICLFNPKKNYKFSKKIMKKGKNINFVPLRGLSQQQLIDLYAKAKVYIDFGNFPGAERIPKEAVKCGCCIITSKYGAAAYYNDVVIPEEYKIEAKDDNIDIIVKKIKYCMDNYDKIKNQFDLYRNTVNHLEQNFINQIIDLLK